MTADFPWSLQHIIPFWSGAEHHDFHHMAFVNNFSTSFRWCDRLFGTDTKYRAYRARLDAAKKAGMSREDAYATVQRSAMATWENLGQPGGRSFRDNLLEDPAVTRLIAPAELDGVMDPARDFTHVRSTLARVFAEA